MVAMNLKKLAAAAVIIVAAAQWVYRHNAPAPQAGPVQVQTQGSQTSSSPGDPVAAAFAQHTSGRAMVVEGRVDRVLADDQEGSRHQRFVLRTPSGITVLVAHNIDLAPRLEGLREGESLRLSGEYVWNERGGLLHWTHRDPNGHHAAGYIERDGRRYQ
jgi:Protein of unknown function (DUF3465)